MTSSGQDWSSFLDPTLLHLGASDAQPSLFDLPSLHVEPSAAPSPTPSLASSSSGSVGGLGVGDADDFSPLSPLLNLFKVQSTFPFPCDADVELAPVPTISPVDAPMLQYNNSILVGSPSARSTTSTATASASHTAQQAEALSLASWVIEEHGRSFAGGKQSSTKTGSRARAASTSTSKSKAGGGGGSGVPAELGLGDSSKDQSGQQQEKMGWLQRLREAEKKAESRGEGSPRVRW